MTAVSKTIQTFIESACQMVGVADSDLCFKAVTEKIEAKKESQTDPAAILTEVQTYKNYSSLEGADCMSKAEQTIFLAINNDRYRFQDEFIQHGWNNKRALPLKVDCDLVRSARIFSQDMAKRHFFNFNHVDPDGKGPVDRILAVTTRFSNIVSENAASGGDWFWSPDNITPAHRWFMESLGHRKNILTPFFTHVGIGIYTNEKKVTFVTEDFGELLPSSSSK